MASSTRTIKAPRTSTLFTALAIWVALFDPTGAVQDHDRLDHRLLRREVATNDAKPDQQHAKGLAASSADKNHQAPDDVPPTMKTVLKQIHEAKATTKKIEVAVAEAQIAFLQAKDQLGQIIMGQTSVMLEVGEQKRKKTKEDPKDPIEHLEISVTAEATAKANSKIKEAAETSTKATKTAVQAKDAAIKAWHNMKSALELCNVVFDDTVAASMVGQECSSGEPQSSSVESTVPSPPPKPNVTIAKTEDAKKEDDDDEGDAKDDDDEGDAKDSADEATETPAESPAEPADEESPTTPEEPPALVQIGASRRKERRAESREAAGRELSRTPKGSTPMDKVKTHLIEAKVKLVQAKTLCHETQTMAEKVTADTTRVMNATKKIMEVLNRLGDTGSTETEPMLAEKKAAVLKAHGAQNMTLQEAQELILSVIKTHELNNEALELLNQGRNYLRLSGEDPSEVDVDLADGVDSLFVDANEARSMTTRQDPKPKASAHTTSKILPWMLTVFVSVAALVA